MNNYTTNIVRLDDEKRIVVFNGMVDVLKGILFVTSQTISKNHSIGYEVRKYPILGDGWDVCQSADVASYRCFDVEEATIGTVGTPILSSRLQIYVKNFLHFDELAGIEFVAEKFPIDFSDIEDVNLVITPLYPIPGDTLQDVELKFCGCELLDVKVRLEWDNERYVIKTEMEHIEIEWCIIYRLARISLVTGRDIEIKNIFVDNTHSENLKWLTDKKDFINDKVRNISSNKE